MFDRLKNPLRYPVNKSKATSIISKQIPRNVRRVVSPFFAGGDLEISLINEGYKIIGHTDYKNLYEFWRCLLDDSTRLSEIGQSLHPIEDKDVFYLMQHRINEHDDMFVRAALFFAINRCTENGTVATGKLMKGHPKFNDYIIQVLKTFKTNKLKILHSSHVDAIKDTNDFILCCPPKYMANCLLGRATLATPESPKVDYERLCELLHAKKQWILLVEYHKDLVEIYKGCNLIYLNELYSHTAGRPSNILITNRV
jgi:site-specific DNA-adenine methylase